MNADEIKNKKLIESRLFEFLEEENEVCEMDPSQLLTPNRFDLAIKLSYLRHKDIAPNFSNQIYSDHLMAFGGGGFYEPEKPGKNSLESFLSEFQHIIESIQENGFTEKESIIPLARDGSILNGAHRVASAIYLGRTVKTIKLNVNPSNYGYDFFLKRHTPWHTLLAGLQEFMQRNPTLRVAVYWPRASSQIDYRPANVVAEYTAELTFKELSGFVRQVYRDEPWLGNPGNNYQGALHKAKNCYQEGSPLKVIAFLAAPDEDLSSIKELIRNTLNMGKHALHISDHAQDTQQVINFIFNENSRNFLALEKPSRFSKKDKRARSVFEALLTVGADVHKTAVDSGCVLEIYGLREAFDIDTISIDSEKNISLLRGMGIDNHNYAYKQNGLLVNEIICNPINNLWYGGVKFISLEILNEFKKRRGEAKDIRDVDLINSLLSQSKWGARKAIIKQRVFYFKYNFVRKGRRFVVGVLKGLGIFVFVKKLFR